MVGSVGFLPSLLRKNDSDVCGVIRHCAPSSVPHAWLWLPLLLVVPRKREMADAAFNRSNSGNLVHEAHGLGDHALVAQRPLEYDLSRRNLCVYPKSR